MSTKFSNYLFLVLTVINFASILTLYYLYTKNGGSNGNPSSSKLSSSVDPSSKNHNNLVIVEVPSLGSKVGGLKKTFEEKVEVVAFLGLPYAAPPVGPLRFRPPQKLPNLTISSNGTEVFEATSWPRPCLQPDNQLRLHNYDFSADCLYMNIWAPMAAVLPPKKAEDYESNKRKKPVIVLIHTGAFLFGSASEVTYDGLALAAQGDLLVVTFNYRLSFYGFAYAGPDSDLITPNLGMLDQVAALSWVREHIAAFGGDPQAVTLVGQSSGALAAGMHITSPLSAGTFQQAVLLSGSPLQTPALNTPQHVAAFWVNYARHLGCLRSNRTVPPSLTKKMLACMETVLASPGGRNRLPTMALVKRSLSADRLFVNLPIVVDGHFQPRSQVELLADQASSSSNFNISLLFGYTDDEGSWIAALEDRPHFGPFAHPSISREEAEKTVEGLILKMRTTKGREVDHANLTATVVEFYLRRLYSDQQQLLSSNNKTEDEGLVLSRLLSSLLGDHYISCPANLFASLLAERSLKSNGSSSNVYQYLWTYKGNPRTSAFWAAFSRIWCGQWMGACHAFEMYALFGAPFLEPASFNSEDRVVSLKTMEMIAYFAHQRKLFWPPFSASAGKPYYLVDSQLDQVAFGVDLKADVCADVWAQYLL